MKNRLIYRLSVNCNFKQGTTTCHGTTGNSSLMATAGFTFFNCDAFIFGFNGGDDWKVDQSSAGTSLVFTGTSYHTMTKTITGIFSGTVKNLAGTLLPITTPVYRL